METEVTHIKTIKIFRTNVRNDKAAAKVVAALVALYPSYKINFDLEDKDSILRIEVEQCEISTPDIRNLMIDLGYSCQEIK